MTSCVATLTAGTWTVDVEHSDVWFTVRHMAVGRARGSFALNSATLYVAEGGIADSSATAEIDATSVDTKQKDRDAQVRSADFLDVEHFPTISFISTAVRDFDGDEFVLVGVLTTRGVSKQVELTVEFLGETVDAFGLTRAGFSATTAISRQAYGVVYDAAFGAGNVIVADRVEIAMDLEFTRNSY